MAIAAEFGDEGDDGLLEFVFGGANGSGRKERHGNGGAGGDRAAEEHDAGLNGVWDRSTRPNIYFNHALRKFAILPAGDLARKVADLVHALDEKFCDGAGMMAASPACSSTTTKAMRGSSAGHSRRTKRDRGDRRRFRPCLFFQRWRFRWFRRGVGGALFVGDDLTEAFANGGEHLRN